MWQYVRLNELYHHGILGQRWGVRRTPEQLGHLSWQDKKWIKKNSVKLTKTATRNASRELESYARELSSDRNNYNKNGKLNAATINAYNKKLVTLMNEQVADLATPSGKAVRFVAKRSEVGVYMALADQGYNMNQIKNGVYSTGKVAYRKTVLDKV